ncbi:MAG TPA: DUF1343 domain-containing protein [Verrucomicrobiota bacterium]|nr:DUF1343 domain-containing protein [Verrucomicrobiota bacterium]HNU52675.1 DUF1343 domain-containing protein [Verrucomicrobiota bacterium]
MSVGRAVLSVGRGTDLPFQVIGAPSFAGDDLARRFNPMGVPAIEAEPHEFTPSQAPYAGFRCHGIGLRAKDRRALRRLRAGFHLLAAAIAACGSRP